jgi:hypothetical protein
MVEGGALIRFRKGEGVAMTGAYSSEDCETIARALDRAWERFLRAGRLGPENIDTAKAALTYAILSEAQSGERNPAVLAERGLRMMEQHEPAVVQQRFSGFVCRLTGA